MASVTPTRYDQAGLVRLAVDFSSYTPVPATVTVTRYATDGTAYTVRGADASLGGQSGLLTGGVGQFDDYEAPLDQNFYYSAVPSSGATITTGTLFLPSDAAFGATMGWLKDPGRPANSVAIMFTGTLDLMRPARQGLFDVLNTAEPVAVSGKRGSARGTATFCTLNPASVTDMVAMAGPGSVLLLQPPGSYLLGNLYIAVGDLRESRATRILADTTRYWALDFTVVTRPKVTSMGFSNSFQDALNSYPTFNDWAAVTFLTILQGQDPNAVGSQTYVNPLYGGTVL
jgi:hypothetical protein